MFAKRVSLLLVLGVVVLCGRVGVCVGVGACAGVGDLLRGPRRRTCRLVAAARWICMCITLVRVQANTRWLPMSCPKA